MTKIYKATYLDLKELVPIIFKDFPFNFKNKRVLIKPNMLSPKKEGVTTSPEVIRAVVGYVLEAGGEVIVGDNPGLISEGAAIQVAKKTGIMEAALGHFRDISKNPSRVKTKEVGEVIISGEVLNCDILISLPRFKTHNLTVLTGAIKNMYGILVGREKPRIHYSFPNPSDFSRAIVSIYEVRRPDLTIIDGIIGMEGFGPSLGSLRAFNRIIVSRNGYEADASLALMAGIAPLSIGFLSWAKSLSYFNPQKIEIVGDFYRIAKFKRPFKLSDYLLRRIIKITYHPRRQKGIKIDKSRCQLCGECVKICPVSGLQQEGEEIRYLRRKCIACFCCIEVCPEGAIR